MARIGVDIDGVCYDFQRAISDWLVDRPGYEHCTMVNATDTWEFYRGWGMSTTEFLALYAEAVNEGVLLWKGRPLPGSVDAVRMLHDLGHTVIFVTDRSIGNEPESATRFWLASCGYKFDEIYFTADKTSVPTDYFVDDKLENYDALDAAGVEVYLLDRPWNSRTDTRRRVDSILAFADIVFNAEASKSSYVEGYARELERVGALLSGEMPLDEFLYVTGPTEIDVTAIDHKERAVMNTETGEVRVVNEKTGGEKGQKLARFDLVPARPMWLVAEHYGRGAQKYEDRNWERGYNWDLSIGAIERHLNLFKQGEDLDTEEGPMNGSPHMAAIIFHALALLEFAVTHPELDTRPRHE